MTNPFDDQRFLRGIDMLKHTGLTEFQIRYSGTNEPNEGGEDDEPNPMVWLALGHWPRFKAWKVGAAFNPLHAVYRLAESVLDGGECLKCHRVTAFVVPGEDPGLLPLMDACVFAWDEKDERFIRSCEKVARDTPFRLP